ncbi:hypothetical protein EK21DRAFT_46860, partial [Setomelanomma holmii]
PFSDKYVFDPNIMGATISREIRYFYIKNTPIYFRGCHDADQVGRRLHVNVFAGQRVRDVVRHLRIYLRCENFMSYLSGLPTGLPYFEDLDERRVRGERYMYELWCSRLAPLHQLPYDKHKIKVEICIFHNFHNIWGSLDTNEDEDQRQKYNLLETVKPVYTHIKRAGANVSVR